MSMILGVADQRRALLLTDTRGRHVDTKRTVSDNITKVVQFPGGFAASGPSVEWSVRQAVALQSATGSLASVQKAIQHFAAETLPEVEARYPNLVQLIRETQYTVVIGVDPEDGLYAAYLNWNGESVFKAKPNQPLAGGPSEVSSVLPSLTDGLEAGILRTSPQEPIDAWLKEAALFHRKVYDHCGRNGGVSPYVEGACVELTTAGFHFHRIPRIAAKRFLRPPSRMILAWLRLRNQVATLVADLGVITAGRVQDGSNTNGIRVSSGYSLPGWTNYIDLTATGAAFFIKTPNFSVDGNGNVVIRGTLSTQAGTSGTFAKVGGVIFTTSVGALTKTANSSGNVWSTTLKGNTLVSVGSSVRVQMRGTMTVAAGSVTLTWTLTLKLGETTIGTFSKSFNGSASAPFVFDAIISKSAANAQGTTSYDIGWNGTVQEIDTALTDTADQTLSCDYSFTTNAAIASTLTMKNVVAEWVQS